VYFVVQKMERRGKKSFDKRIKNAYNVSRRSLKRRCAWIGKSTILKTCLDFVSGFVYS
jgi:hypothetical protein